MSNHLTDQSSPYLLQHAENPVDWFPWGEEAFQKAEREDKPVFLSVGYSTCHWCHVMARESFEDKETADILNRYFISVKVDREERPDIDSVYMSVCQELTGSGGWPMSIFMTAQQKPFFAGTYFPPEGRRGMPGFRDVLLAIVRQWKDDRGRLLASADEILTHILAQDEDRSDGIEHRIDRTLPDRAVSLFTRSFDEEYGGFGSAPKFPVPHNLLFLTLYARVKGGADRGDTTFRLVRKTLEQMRRGGIFDQIGYGFSRYSTDPYYLVPHFEKMLYDNALLMLAYAAAYKVSDDPVFLDTAEMTAGYLFREMTGPEGEFYAAQDADSGGEEGSFYVWKYDEILQILGEETGIPFCEYFGITKQGNFEGKNIPNLLAGGEISDVFAKERHILYKYRRSRARLHLDDKVLTSWNSLMICALVYLYRVTGRTCCLLIAQRTQSFIEKNLTEKDILYVSCRGGERSGKGFLDEYAYYMAALISLYEVTADPACLERAVQIFRQAERQFLDERDGGYFLYGPENGTLITRPKETYDGALPSGNSVMAYCLVRLSQILGEEEYITAAERQLTYLSNETQYSPMGHSMFLTALLIYEHMPAKITVVLSEKDKKEDILPRLPLCTEVRFVSAGSGEYRLVNGITTYYVCRGNVCLPATNEEPPAW